MFFSVEQPAKTQTRNRNMVVCSKNLFNQLKYKPFNKLTFYRNIVCFSGNLRILEGTKIRKKGWHPFSELSSFSYEILWVEFFALGEINKAGFSNGEAGYRLL